MNTADLAERLSASERKRAALVAEAARLQIELERARRSGNSGSGAPAEAGEVQLLRARLAASEAQRATLLRELEATRKDGGASTSSSRARGSRLGGGGAADESGGLSITAVPEPPEADFAAEDDEEEEARQRAEQVMAQLLQCLAAQRDAEQLLGAVQVELAELRSSLDQARIREATLLTLVDEYQSAWRRSQDSPERRLFAGEGGPVTAGAEGASHLRAAAPLCDIRVRALEGQVAQLQEELAALRAENHHDQQQCPAAAATPVVAAAATAPAAATADERLLLAAHREHQLLELIAKLQRQVVVQRGQMKDLKATLRAQAAAVQV